MEEEIFFGMKIVFVDYLSPSLSSYYIHHSNTVAVARIIITLARPGDDNGRYCFSPSAYQCVHDIDLNAYTGVYVTWLFSAQAMFFRGFS